MPLLKPDAAPLPPEAVAALRSRLVRPYEHELVETDDRRLLFLRSAHDVPDPVEDLEAGFEEAPAWALRDVDDVFLLGARGDLHVPGHIARPVYERRLRQEAALADRARGTLDVQYGVRVHHDAADAPGRDRLLARVPRERCVDVDEADLVGLARSVGPLHEAAALDQVRTCLLVAEADHVRLRARDLLADLLERWHALREAEAAAPPPPPPRRPRVEDVTPAVELEAQVDAAPPHAVALGAAAEAEDRLAERLLAAGFEVARAPYLPDSPFTVEARRASLFPRRVGVLVRARFDRADASEALQLVRDRRMDLVLVVTDTAGPQTLKRLAASRVRVVAPADAATLRF